MLVSAAAAVVAVVVAMVVMMVIVITVVIMLVVMVLVLLLLMMIVAMAPMAALPFCPCARDRYRMAETRGSVSLVRASRARRRSAGHAQTILIMLCPFPASAAVSFSAPCLPGSCSSGSASSQNPGV